jgi:hypothetical protein
VPRSIIWLTTRERDMKQLTERRNHSVEHYNPGRYRLNVAALDYSIKEAKRIRNWEALEQAVDAKIEEQRKFIVWWDAQVQKAGGDRQSEVSKALAGSAADALLPVRRAEEDTGMPHQRVSDLRAALEEDPEGYRDGLLGPQYRAAFLAGRETDTSRRIQQSNSKEYYTPARYLAAAREVLGDIDLDPASNDHAQALVRAGAYFTKENDLLKPEWWGRVWLNPPYGDLVGKFIDKLSIELKAGRVTAAVCLVNAHCTDTDWFKPLWDGVLCFTDHRIDFAGGSFNGSSHGSVSVYFGPDRPKFVSAFRQFGTCVGRL